ncbi:MAG: MTAP family purine nucleoside phosphorylase [Candidatus Margulisbacteria bacterium]|jgi:5'-methylthioadenosine phosphorylase|nr:MTAP family purine nucleoside phosphorylase [Candidatus Margulisiibacteriota bacterium]
MAERIAIIGGSGVAELDLAGRLTPMLVTTPFGTVPVQLGEYAGREIIFLLRHGKDYCLPSEINYRANISALKRAGVGQIIATAAVGAINRAFKPGDLATLDDFIDFTRGGRDTFIKRQFLDVSRPYDQALNRQILRAAKALKLKLHANAIYACAEGPRFETRAEIRMYGQAGADVVGMTQVPEVVLATEAGIPYAVIAVITNYAAGVTGKPVDGDHVVAVMKKKKKALTALLKDVVAAL